MLQQAILCLFALVVLVHAFDTQLPLWSGQDAPHITREDRIPWNLNNFPDPNATDHLVFETVHSLLQHWPNTRMRNGHNIVPGTIPKGTLLYHGTNRRELPPGPEWVAVDPEHSYHFCLDPPGEHVPQGCWQLTLATTRPFKIIYFDGSSAARLPYGSMDTQDLLAWGGPRPGPGSMMDEWQRIQSLCDWGKDFDVDGFVRMEMDFEAMLCNFTSGVSVVSFSNLEVSRHGGTWRAPSFEVFNAGSWHNHFPGETRVHLDLSGLISFYDTRLAPSLIDIRAGQERWDHRVQNISTEDLSAVKSRLEAILTRPPGHSSGIDWRTLIQVVVDRYGQRLELTRYLLNSSTTDPVEILDLANKTQSQLRTILAPYLLFSATPTNPSDRDDLDWATPIYRLCSMTHTFSMDSELESMTYSEKLLLQAVRGTTREICRVVTKMWTNGVYTGLDRVLNSKQSPDIAEITYLWSAWKEDLDRLMGWLDWNVWVRCDPGCSFEEICYLPTWPMRFPVPGWPRSLHPGSPGPERLTGSDLRNAITESFMDEWDAAKPFEDEWMRPQPRCIRRVEPYNF